MLGAQLVITSAHDYTQPVYSVGMGCERDCSIAELIELLNNCLHQASITADQISNISSIDVKANEPGLIQLANIFGWPFETWDKTELQKVEHQLTQKSDIVFKEVGVYGVAEAAALVSASQLTGQVAELVLPKQKSARATCAIARSYYG
jgi:cobalt-precorrin 5A hydrolase